MTIYHDTLKPLPQCVGARGLQSCRTRAWVVRRTPHARAVDGKHPQAVVQCVRMQEGGFMAAAWGVGGTTGG